jgi:kumamolisin
MGVAQFRTAIRYPKTAQPLSLLPREVAAAYNFPIDKATGKGYVGGIIELGGGYRLTDVNQYFADQGLPQPTFRSVSVAGGKNKQDGPNGADGEVQLDMLIAGSVAGGASFNVYFCPNTDQGFLDGIKQARADGCHGVSISWGGPENSWTAAVMGEFEAEIKACRAAGVPVFVASGDTGSQDSSGAGNQTDFPASSPSAIGCGGTRLLCSASKRVAETVWNDNSTQSATGGGVSKQFPGRDVPDIAGNADPDTGYEVAVDGEQSVIGGTSAVAPLMLGLHALLWELSPKLFDFMNLIVTNPQACYDVTVGSNGGYRAGPGRDETTGFGVPDGALLLEALTGGVPAPVPPSPPPTPAPPTNGVLASFPVTPVQAWLNHNHTHTMVEAAAAKALKAWGDANGLPL